jgi:chitodextrinase
VNGAVKYQVEVMGQSIEVGDTTTYIVDNLTPNTQYSFRICAINNDDKGNWSETFSAKTLPDEAKGISLEEKTNEIIVTWEKIAGVISYDLEVDGNIINNIKDTKYIHPALVSNTQHSYRIRGVNKLGNANWSEYVHGQTLLEVPNNITITEEVEKDNTNYAIQWDNSEEATKYEIKINGNITEVTGNKYTHQDIQPSTTYTYEIRSLNDTNKSEWSSVLSKTSKPNTPIGLTAIINNMNLEISFQGQLDASKYEIEVDGKLIEIGLSTNYIYKDLLNNKEYTIRVRAIGVGGNSRWSEYITIKSPVASPMNLRATSVTDNSITLMWDAVEGATEYELLIDGKSHKINSTDTYVHNNLKPDSLHIYRIRTNNDNKPSKWSKTLKVKTKVSGVLDINVEDVTSNKIKLSWDKVEGAEGYTIDLDGQIIDLKATNTYTHEKLLANSTHKYRVQSYGSNGPSEWSKYITVKTTPDIPTNIKAKATNDSIVVSWDEVAGCTKYEIEADGKIITVETLSYKHIELQPNSLHKYRVRSIVEDNKSKWSEVITKNTLPILNIKVNKDNYFNFIFVIPANGNSERYVSVYYNNSELDVIDLCGTTPKLETESGIIENTNMEIVTHDDGYILYKITDINKAIVNAIKFQSKTNNHSKVRYEVE